MNNYLGHEFAYGKCVNCGAVEKSVRQFGSRCSKAVAPSVPATLQEDAPAAPAEQREEKVQPVAPIADEPAARSRLNRIVKVQFTAFGNAAIDAAALLDRAVERENADGWRVIQVLADDKSDETLTNQILRLVTLGFYRKQNGYILVLER